MTQAQRIALLDAHIPPEADFYPTEMFFAPAEVDGRS